MWERERESECNAAAVAADAIENWMKGKDERKRNKNLLPDAVRLVLAYILHSIVTHVLHYPFWIGTCHFHLLLLLFSRPLCAHYVFIIYWGRFRLNGRINVVVYYPRIAFGSDGRRSYKSWCTSRCDSSVQYTHGTVDAFSSMNGRKLATMAQYFVRLAITTWIRQRTFRIRNIRI